MHFRAKTICFHISQLLLIIAIIATGMPARAAVAIEFDRDRETQIQPLKAIGLSLNPGILAG